MQAIIETITNFGAYLLSLLLFVPRTLFSEMVDILLSISDWFGALIPIESLTGVLSNIPPGVLWFASILDLNFALPTVLGAYAVRFLIRRLPVIG